MAEEEGRKEKDAMEVATGPTPMPKDWVPTGLQVWRALEMREMGVPTGLQVWRTPQE